MKVLCLLLLFLVLVTTTIAEIQSIGGRITQIDLVFNFSYQMNNDTKMILVNEKPVFTSLIISPFLSNPYFEDGFLYYEVN
jgi:hypothetical protein